MATFENTDVHFSLLPLLDTLPELGDEWHVEDRRKWLESLDATLAALYPIPGAAQETRPTLGDFAADLASTVARGTVVDDAEMLDSETPADLVGALQDRVHTDVGPFRAGQSVKETRVDDGRCICLAGVSDIPEHDEDCPRRQAKAPICSCGTPYGKYCPISPGDK